MMHRLFNGGRKPTAQEDRLYACAKALHPLREDLIRRFTLPEAAGSIYKTQQTAEAWSFELLQYDKLQKKGWPVYPGEGRDKDLCLVLRVLAIQSEGGNSRYNFNHTLADYKKEGGVKAHAVTFLTEHVGELEAAIAELGACQQADLTARHKCLLVLKADKIKPDNFDDPASDIGAFVSGWRISGRMRVLSVPMPASVKRPKGLSL